MVSVLALLAAACGDDAPAADTEAPTTTTTAAPATTTTIPADPLAEFPAEGLLAAFLADEGITSNPDTTIASWEDATGSMVLEPTGKAPRVVAAGHAGRNIVRFESGDGPGFTSSASAVLPAGNTDRTLIVAGSWVADSTSSHYNILGAGWGDPLSGNASFMLGNVHFNCFSQDIYGITTNLGSVGSTCGGQTAGELLATDTALLDGGFITVVATVESGELHLFLRDREVAVSDHVFETVPVHFWIGNWQSIEESSGFDVIAVLAYDRALAQEEITQVVTTLRTDFGVDE